MLWGPIVGKLRWTLLILGGLFILALALWERLRPRQARPRARHEPEPRAAQPPSAQIREEMFPRVELGPLPSAGSRAAAREPWIGEPGLHEAAALGDPPTVLIDDLVPARADESADESPTAELPVLSESAVDIPAQSDQALQEQDFIEGVGPVTVRESVTTESRAAQPIVEWPPEESRHIVALRLVASTERFPGRALRQALAAEGFLLGKFDIFHQPDEAHRAIVSAASLTRPGTFELDTMDSQRYAGLNLFAVLPGPLPEQQAFDRLVDAAHNLCERLQGELQDARGETLTSQSLETLRAALPQEPRQSAS